MRNMSGGLLTMSEVCESCIYRRMDSYGSGYVCTNPDSEYVGEWVLPDDFCELYDKRE